MNNRIKSLALLVNLGIYGVAFPLSAAEAATDDKNSAAEETMVVTAAEQNLQAPGVSTITADEIRKRPPGARRLGDHSHHAGGQPDRQLHQRPARQQPPD